MYVHRSEIASKPFYFLQGVRWYIRRPLTTIVIANVEALLPSKMYLGTTPHIPAKRIKSLKYLPSRLLRNCFSRYRACWICLAAYVRDLVCLVSRLDCLSTRLVVQPSFAHRAEAKSRSAPCLMHRKCRDWSSDGILSKGNHIDRLLHVRSGRDCPKYTRRTLLLLGLHRSDEHEWVSMRRQCRATADVPILFSHEPTCQVYDQVVSRMQARMDGLLHRRYSARKAAMLT